MYMPNSGPKYDLCQDGFGRASGATTGSRPTEREGEPYRTARAPEFPPLRNENSGGPKFAEPTNKSGALADAALVGGTYVNSFSVKKSDDETTRQP